MIIHNNLCDHLREVNEKVKMSEKINYKKLCVRQNKEGFLYPKTIPKERGQWATGISYGFCVILFLVYLFLEDSIFRVIMQYFVEILLAIFLELFYRFILMAEEQRHLKSRYDNSILTLLKDVFNFQVPVWVAFFICAIYTVYYLSTHSWSFGSYNIFRIVSMLANVHLWQKVLKMNSGPLNDSLWIAENNGLDYGAGMAYSFFHGYLNIVLLKTGREDKNLLELMKEYEDSNRIRFTTYKLFILIPKSMRCFVSLKNEYSPSIEESSSLLPKELTVAGVQNRIYKNAVYKIISKDKYMYVSAEYATPLKTFKDVLDSRGDHSEFYNKHKKDIILQFYLTLGKLLEKTGLCSFCELIYYEDSFQKDGITCYYDVGKIILERIKESEKRSKVE